METSQHTSEDDLLHELLLQAQGAETEQARAVATEELCKLLGNTVRKATAGFTDRFSGPDDIGQDAMERFLRSAVHGDQYSPGTVRGYIHRIAKNRMLDVMRRNSRLHFGPDDDLATTAGNHDTWQEAAELDSHARVRALLIESGCDEDQSTAICLHHVLGFSYDEIAAITDVKLGTVRSRISRGLRKIRSEHDISDDTDYYDLFEGLANVS